MSAVLLGSTKTLNISSNTEYEKLKILARWQTSHIKLSQVIINGLKLFQQHRSQAEALFFLPTHRHGYLLHGTAQGMRSRKRMSVW